MSESQFHRGLVTGLVFCASLAFLLGRIQGRFVSHWRHLKDGMTQSEVTETLGRPNWTGKTFVRGAGDQPVTRWEYKRGRYIYCVDFDYIGPQSAPVVYRTEHFQDEWNWPWWSPYRPPKCRG